MMHKSQLTTRFKLAFLFVLLGVVAVPVAVAAAPPTSSSGVPNLDQVRQSSAEAAAAAGATAQAEVLSKGLPTQAEYRMAILATLDCARTAGLEVIGPTERYSGLILSYGVRDPNSPSNEKGPAAFDACYGQHARFVDMTYQLAAQPKIKAINDTAISCLVAAGLLPESSVKGFSSDLGAALLFLSSKSTPTDSSKAEVAQCIAVA